MATSKPAIALALSLALIACGGLIDDGDEPEHADSPSDPEPVCQPGERRCKGAVLQACSDDSAWRDLQTCANQSACTPERCTISPEPCKPASLRCHGAERQECQQNRTWWRVEVCGDAAACEPDGCLQNDPP